MTKGWIRSEWPRAHTSPHGTAVARALFDLVSEISSVDQNPCSLQFCLKANSEAYLVCLSR